MWNHRVIKRVYKDVPGYDHPVEIFGIHEVYYDENNKVMACTKNPITVSAESLSDLKWSIDKIVNCLDKPTLDYDKIPEEGAKSLWPTEEELESAEPWEPDAREEK